MEIRNGRLALEVDRRTGSIVRIADVATGIARFDTTLDRARLGRSFRVIAPSRRWSSRPGDGWTSGAPRIERHDGGLRLLYPDLAGPGGPLGVEAELRIDVLNGPDEVRLTLRVTNHGDGDVTDVLFPWLGGWRPDAPGTDAITLGGARRVDPHSFPVNRGITFSRWHQRESYTYPIDLFAPWVDASGRAGGVGVASLQRTGRNLGVFIENLAGYEPGLELSLGFVHFTQTRPGETWESPPIRITIHGADWHATADRYAAWADEWFQPPPTPLWARRSLGFQNVLFQGFDGTRFRSFATIPDIARAGVRADFPHLCVWDYAMLGAYHRFDDLPQLGFEPGDRDRLRTALAAARAEGARVSSLQNLRLMKPTSTLFRSVGHQELCLRYDGTPFVEEYCGSLHHGQVITRHTGPMVYPVDPRIATVRERVLETIEATLDLGFDSHFYDQPFQDLPSYHPGRGEDGPDGVHAATVELLRLVRARIARRGEEGILIGEYCDVFGAQAIDLWMSWYTDMGDAVRAVYSIPRTLNSWVVDHDRAAASRAFAIGAQLCLTARGGESPLTDLPDFAAHIARLARLRARAERVHLGRFRDREGIEVEADGDVVAGAFTSPAGPAVVIAAPGAAADARIRLDRERLHPPHDVAEQARPSGRAAAEPRLLRLDGRDRETGRSDRLRLRLRADEVAVWYP
jgi:hypothetical protein